MGEFILKLASNDCGSAVRITLQVKDADSADELLLDISDALEKHAPEQITTGGEYRCHRDEHIFGKGGRCNICGQPHLIVVNPRK